MPPDPPRSNADFGAWGVRAFARRRRGCWPEPSAKALWIHEDQQRLVERGLRNALTLLQHLVPSYRPSSHGLAEASDVASDRLPAPRVA